MIYDGIRLKGCFQQPIRWQHITRTKKKENTGDLNIYLFL